MHSEYGEEHRNLDLQQPTRRTTYLVEDVWFYALEDAEDIHIDTTAFADYVTEHWIEGQERDQ